MTNLNSDKTKTLKLLAITISSILLLCICPVATTVSFFLVGDYYSEPINNFVTRIETPFYEEGYDESHLTEAYKNFELKYYDSDQKLSEKQENYVYVAFQKNYLSLAEEYQIEKSLEPIKITIYTSYTKYKRLYDIDKDLFLQAQTNTTEDIDLLVNLTETTNKSIYYLDLEYLATHELNHVMQRIRWDKSMGYLPDWYLEGLAEHFTFKYASQANKNNDYLEYMKQVKCSEALYCINDKSYDEVSQLDELIRSNRYEEVIRGYALSWGMITYMASEYNNSYLFKIGDEMENLATIREYQLLDFESRFNEVYDKSPEEIFSKSLYR